MTFKLIGVIVILVIVIIKLVWDRYNLFHKHAIYVQDDDLESIEEALNVVEDEIKYLNSIRRELQQKKDNIGG